jgi:hypothetical protein
MATSTDSLTTSRRACDLRLKRSQQLPPRASDHAAVGAQLTAILRWRPARSRAYGAAVTSKVSSGASGAIRRFAGWVARGSVGHPMLEGIGYWDDLRDSPSQMETCFAVFVNVLELDDSGQPVNEKYAEMRAATWLYKYCTGSLPPGQADLEPWETALY